jgi:hypothetical protein
MTISGPVSLKIFAVSVRVIVTGAGPQLNVITPPCATAWMKAAELQLSGLPLPITWSGLETSSRSASSGMLHAAPCTEIAATSENTLKRVKIKEERNEHIDCLILVLSFISYEHIVSVIYCKVGIVPCPAPTLYYCLIKNLILPKVVSLVAVEPVV